MITSSRDKRSLTNQREDIVTSESKRLAFCYVKNSPAINLFPVHILYDLIHIHRVDASPGGGATKRPL
ncbi:hypothetical protein N7540_003193 [Penicillium herquei]|nr:hypothetical protein N7540_003193 [Penicillium herquei]